VASESDTWSPRKVQMDEVTPPTFMEKPEPQEAQSCVTAQRDSTATGAIIAEEERFNGIFQIR